MPYSQNCSVSAGSSNDRFAFIVQCDRKPGCRSVGSVVAVSVLFSVIDVARTAVMMGTKKK